MNRDTGTLYIVSGPSGVGKSTVLREVFRRRPDLFFSVSVTTRAPRPGETDGVHYHFLTDEAYDRLLERDLLLEHAGYGGNRYGTPAEPIRQALEAGRDVVLDIESVGMASVKQKMPQAVSIFLAPPDWDSLERRLRSRATETEERVRIRLEAAHRELQASSRYDYTVVNDTVERAADEIMEIMDRYCAGI